VNYRGVIHFVATPKKAGICALQCVAVCCRVLLIVAACCSATESRYSQMQIGRHKILRFIKLYHRTRILSMVSRLLPDDKMVQVIHFVRILQGGEVS